ncbi:MFS transporter [Henriciella sp.]|uniref:MFS transporter n=1 Tax=Henriciella sp. TaxID=1968823 RepID=UPI0026158620|nr:MFS transporter [Henriciella sp.]
MTWGKHIAIAGFGATAIAFGPARMGFGLFLPELRQAFSLSTSLAGAIASAGLLAFLLALPLTAWMVRRANPKLPVIAGTLSASIGFLAVATATGPLQLLAGILFASTSAGLCWAPFNGAAERFISQKSQASVLAVIASGTSVGILFAAVLALCVTYEIFSWRYAWGAFSMAALLIALAAFFEMPSPSQQQTTGPEGRFPRLARYNAAPLYLAALAFGATNAVYFSFAADRVVAAGGLPGLREGAAAAVVFLSYGAFGILGTLTGRAEAATGMGWLLRMVFAAAALSLLLIAFAPQSWSSVILSAGLQGAALMAASSIFSLWSLRLFPGNGTTGFLAALVGLAAGSVLGPAIAGLLEQPVGPQGMFLIASVPVLLLALWPGKLVSIKGLP